ncbi:MAG: hypothetical protein PF495_03605 [Spirochaetales bacterium]|jgi:hypothetical protein|nr:hypothetical protein [Spirochaetales bacterium]
MEKKTQRCPYCQEAIYANAIVCRYCRRDLPPSIPPLRPTEPSWIPLLIGAALVIGIGTILRSNLICDATAEEKKPAE